MSALARLQTSLRYAAPVDWPAIRAMIAALLDRMEAELANTPSTAAAARPSEGCSQEPPARRVDAERAVAAAVEPTEYPEERSGTAREAPGTGMRDGTAPAAVHTPAAASVGVQPAAPLPSDVQPRCRKCGREFVRSHHNQRYCGRECQQTRVRPEGYRRARPVTRAPIERESETRQAPAARPPWRLEWHSEVVIGPDRPAQPGTQYFKRHADGTPCRYQDDLAAIAEHGSPGRLP